MPSYSYTAKSEDGESKGGLIEAKDKVEVARILRREGLVPLTINVSGADSQKEEGESILRKITKFDVNRVLDRVRGVPLADKMMFSRHLAVMISAGVPLTKALNVLARQSHNYKFKKAISKIEEGIRKGNPLSDSLSKHPGIFNMLYVSMVRSGETAGNLSEVLELLANELKKEYELRSRIKGALMYPSVVVIAMGGIGILMMTMVVPKIAEIFEELGSNLPITTRIIIGTSDFLSKYWIFAIASFIPLLYLFKKFLATNIGKRTSSWIFLKLPTIRPITQKINSARFARTLSSLLGGGVPILDSLTITKDTLGNYYYKRSIDKIREEVKKGKTLYESISHFENIYPSLIVQMVEVGEETGELGNILNRIAEFYEEEVSNATKNLSSIIEPILMLVIGSAVGFFAVSMIQPMYSVMGNI